jgi:GH3 auxin-responsive promoter
MNEALNDSFRFIISCGLRMLGAIFALIHRLRILLVPLNQNRLRARHELRDDTPVCAYDRSMEAHINATASGKGGKVRFAITSGSTGTPKRLLYTKARLRMLKFVFSDFYLRCCWALSIRRTSLYVFSSFSQDQSLTSMLLEEERLPSYFATLQAPYRIQTHPGIDHLRAKYGDTAVRLWVLTLSNPGVLYSTNPSTLSTFFDELHVNWHSHSLLIRDWCQRPNDFERSVCRLANLISSKGSARRLAAIASLTTCPPLEVYAPAVATYICWTGGYVKPFLDRLEKYLPAPRYLRVPMYSMSTETVETIIDIRGSSISFLPIAPGVHYEFRKANEELVLEPHELEVGHSYSLIVTDNYGLKRYDTGDQFFCREKVRGLPDLFFQRRRDLEYSFTGEKLTAAQVTTVFETIRSSLQSCLSDQFLTCIPSAVPVPHYKLVVVADESHYSREPLVQLSSHCDRLLCEINCEYKVKRDSGRLGPLQAVILTRDTFVKLALGSKAGSWETQFKFLPLYVQTWEAMMQG